MKLKRTKDLFFLCVCVCVCVWDFPLSMFPGFRVFFLSMFVGFRVLVFPGVCGGFCIEEEKNGRGALAALAFSSSGLVFLWGLMIRSGRNGRGVCN